MTVPDDAEYAHDYEAVAFDSDRPREPGSMTDFDAAQRRAYLLEYSLELGTPSRITQSTVCEWFGVSQHIISRDINQELKPYIEDRLGSQAKFISDRVFKGAIQQLFEDGEPYKAAKVVKEMNDWLQSTGNQESEQQTDEISVQFSDS